MTQSVGPMTPLSSPGMPLNQSGAQLVGAFNDAFAHLVSDTSTVNYDSLKHSFARLTYMNALFAGASYPAGGKLEVTAKYLGGRLFAYPEGIGLKSPQDRLVYAKALQQAIHQLLDVLGMVDDRNLVVDQLGSNSFSDQLVNYITKDAAMPVGIDDTLSQALVRLKASVKALNQGFVTASLEAPVAAATAPPPAPAPVAAPVAQAPAAPPAPAQLGDILNGSDLFKFIHAFRVAEDAHPHGNSLTHEQRSAIHWTVNFEFNGRLSSLSGPQFWEAYCQARHMVTGQ